MKKTVTLGWLLRQYPVPSLAYSSNKYQYYYCPTDAENPYNCPATIVKIKKDYVIKKNEEKWPQDENSY